MSYYSKPMNTLTMPHRFLKPNSYNTGERLYLSEKLTNEGFWKQVPRKSNTFTEFKILATSVRILQYVIVLKYLSSPMLNVRRKQIDPLLRVKSVSNCTVIYFRKNPLLFCVTLFVNHKNYHFSTSTFVHTLALRRCHITQFVARKFILPLP